MKPALLYYLCISSFFICPKELFTTKEFEENNRSAEIDQHFLTNNLIQFLNYRAYKDSFINAAQKDSTANFGLIADRVSFTMYNNENEMYFGNDRDKCIIHYTSFSKYQKTEPAMIDLFSKKKSNGPERQKLKHTLSKHGQKAQYNTRHLKRQLLFILITTRGTCL